MRAVVLTGLREAHLGEFRDPVVGEDDVLVRVAYCGICGTDLHKFDGHAGSHGLSLPVPLGHEISGVVEQVGPAVTRHHVGERVTVDPNWSCGACWYCQNGMPHMCDRARGVVKGLADYVCSPESNVYALPDGLSLQDAALSEPLSCCLRGMDRLDVRLGQTVAIIGLGAIGLIMLQLVRLAAAGPVVVIDSDESKRQRALELGATCFANSATEDVGEVLRQHGIGNVDRVIECVGLPVTVSLAIEIAGKCATVVLFGLGDGRLDLDYRAIMHKELDVRASFVNPHTMGRAVALLASGALDTGQIVSKVIAPEEVVPELEQRQNTRRGKVVVHWADLK